MGTRTDRVHVRPLRWIGAVVFAFAAGLVALAQAPPVPDAGAAGQGAAARRAEAVPDFTKQPPIVAKRPDEQLKQFILQPGYRLELVLSDPVIQEPTAIAFDGNGRMFVLEDRSYMLDADMTGQLDPISRISLHVGHRTTTASTTSTRSSSITSCFRDSSSRCSPA